MKLCRWSFHRPSLVYAATSVASSLMSGVFGFYYVKVYLNVFHVSGAWFHIAQLIYLIWNALNDPLSGYIQDNWNFFWVKSRRHSILYGAPFYGLAFILIWFPWGDYSEPTWLCGLQLLVVLSFYDTMFTFVLLAQCALFAEMSTHPEDRLRLVRYSQIASLLGSSGVFFASYISNNLEDFTKFQIVCTAIGFLSVMCFMITGEYANTKFDRDQVINKIESSDRESANLSKTNTRSWWTLMKQIFTERNFIAFILVNFCQVYHSTFLSNFTGIITDRLVGKDDLPDFLRTMFYSSMFILPQVLVLSGSGIIGSIGYYSVIRTAFALKIILAFLMLMIGMHPLCLVIFFLIDRAFCGSTFTLFNLCLSDIVDEDMELYSRSRPVSACVFGFNALVTKPAQSLAPMFAVMILKTYNYQDSSTPGTTNIPNPELDSAMFSMACWTPIVLGVIQLFIWSKYTIRNSHIILPKHVEE